MTDLLRPDTPPSPTVEDLNARLATLKGKCADMRERIVDQRSQFMNATLPSLATDLRPISSSPMRLRHRLTGHRGKVVSCDWASNSQHVVSVAMDGLALMWDAYSSYKSRVFLLPSCYVLSCALPPSCGYLATAGLDNKVSIHSMTFSPDESDPTVPYNSNSTRMKGLTKRDPMAILKGHSAYIADLCFLSDQQIISASGDMTCCVWDVNTGRRVSTLYDHLGDVVSVAKHPSNMQLVATASQDKTVKIWDLRIAKCVQTFQGHNRDVNSVHFFPDGNAVLSGGEDSTARLFNMRTDCQMNIYSAPNIMSSVNSVTATPSGRLMFCGHDTGEVVAWDTIKCTYLGPVTRHNGPVTNVKVSPDGVGLLSASWDETMTVLSL
ncbi:Guanine nucleotide-binding protein subunit beta [Yarrowia sp. B02]|nr:Guanine nucleotide-binding protein subunit beta [Yarrowia sp. B02]